MSRRTVLFLVVLALVTAAIVIHDVVRDTGAPASAEPNEEPAPAAASPPVSRALSRAALIYPGEFASDLAARLRLALGIAEPAGGGAPERALVLSPRTAVIPAGSPATTWVVRIDSQAIDADLAGIDVLHGIALLRLRSDAPAAAAIQSVPPPLPEPLLAMRPEAGRPTMQYLPASNLRLAERVARASVEPGDALVNLEGQMVGFIGRTMYGAASLDAALVQEIVEALGADGRHPHPSLGLDLQTITGALRTPFPRGTLAVVYVVPRSDAETAGFRAGQTFASASIGSRRFTTAEALSRAMRPGDVVTFERVDGRKPLNLSVQDVQTSPHDAPAARGLSLESETGVPIVVTPGSLAARAGLMSGDRLEAVDLRPAQRSAMNRLLRSGRAALLTIERGDRHRFIWLPEASAPPPRSSPQ